MEIQRSKKSHHIAQKKEGNKYSNLGKKSFIRLKHLPHFFNQKNENYTTKSKGEKWSLWDFLLVVEFIHERWKWEIHKIKRQTSSNSK